MTADVDVIATDSEITAELTTLAQRGSALHLKHRVYLDWVGVVILPEEYDSRLTELEANNFKNIRIFILDPYDIALSKLGRNNNSPRDIEDVKFLAQRIPFDLDILRTRYERELRPYLSHPYREDTTLALWIEAIEEERSADA